MDTKNTQISYKICYRTIPTMKKPANTNLINHLTNLIHPYRDCITSSECHYFNNFRCKSNNIYGLPTVHKSKLRNITSTITKANCMNIYTTTDLKLRHIIATALCETHCQTFPRYPIKTSHQTRSKLHRGLFNFLEPCTKDNNCIVSIDVVNLYSNIPDVYRRGHQILARNVYS